MKILSKINALFGLLRFITRYPGTVILGGPQFLRFFGKRFQCLPKSFYSQQGQDGYLTTEYYREFSKPTFPRIFLDVGCNHPKRHSNSYFFEKHMDFMVIGVDALDKYQAEWKNERPNAELLVTAVGESVGILEFEETEHDDYEGDMYSAVKGQSNKAEKLNRKNRKVPVTTLTNILQSRGVLDVGIMSMDIEGYELIALHGLDFKKIKVRLIILENNSNSTFGDEEVRRYMLEKGYIFKARIWGLDDVFEFSEG